MKTTFRRLGAAARALALMAGFIAATQTAYATCAGPAGNAGDIIYASNYNAMAFCNGTTWTSMAGGVSVTVNTSGGGTANPAGSTGDVQFNTANALDADTGNFFWDKTNHRLGIGTNTPNAPIQVAGGLSVGTASSTLYQPNGQTLQINGGSGGSARLVFDSTVLGGAPFYIASSGSYLNIGRYAPSTLAIMTVQSDTNVGIGTTAAAVSLSVVGEVQVSSSGAVCSSGVNAGAIRYSSGTLSYCNGSNTWTSLSGGGSATPAGSTNDVQFNAAGVLAADTGKFTYTSATGVLAAPAVSGTSHYGQYASFTTIYNPGTFSGNSIAANSVSSTLVSASNVSATYIQIQSATTVLSCGGNLAGAMRYTSGTMQVCDGSGWTNIGLGVPQGTIAAFALSSCPNGWSEYTPARGRFLRGIDNGAGLDPNGTRAPGNLQADAFQGHWHEYVGDSPGGSSGPTNTSAHATSGAAATVVQNPTSDGVDGTPRTSSETRPVNVAVTFCRYDGFQSQLQTGVATLASLTDVSVAGATAGQVLTYNGGTWIASTTTGGGTAQGDRITSGTLSIIANTGSAYASLTTNGTTWGYLGSNASYIPTLQTGFENNGTISTTLIQTGTNSATCSSGLYGSIRWNATSDTIQVCNSAGWISVASSTTPNTTISQGQNNYAAIFSGPNTLVTDSALYVDRTNHHVGIGTVAPGYTLAVSGSIVASSSAAYSGLAVKGGGPNDGSEISIGNDSGSIFGIIAGGSSNPGFPNGLFFYDNQLAKTRMAFFADGNSTLSGNLGLGTNSPGSSLTVVAGEIQTGYSGSACNSATNGGAIRYASGSLYYCNGSNTWTSLGGGGGSPAGSTGDIQFNNAGSFAADTGNLFWDKTNHLLGIGTNSPSATLTVVSGSFNPALMVSGSIGLGVPTVGTWRGTGIAMRNYSTESNGIKGATIVANTGSTYFGRYDATSATTSMVINSSGNVGIGTTPLVSLEVSTSTGLRASSKNGAYYATTLLANQLYTYNTPLYINYASTSNTIINANGGNVGVGTISPANTVDISGTLRTFDYVNSAGYVNPLSIAVGNNSGGTNYSRIALGQVTTNNMFIEAADQSNTKGTLMLQPYGGYVTVNSTASPTYALTVGGDVYLTAGWLRTTGATGWYNQTYGGGWYMTDSTYIRNYASKEVLLSANITAPAFLYSSDKRLKSDITTLTGGLAKLDTLNPVSFRFTSDPSKTTHLGLIAQDVRKVYPEAVHADDKGFLKLDYPSLIGPMIGMMKELKSIVFANRGDLVEAKAEIRQLKADNDNLEAANRTLKAANDNAMRRLDALERTQRAHGW